MIGTRQQCKTVLVACLILISLMGVPAFAGTKIIDYGFEDWSGSANTSPGYIFTTGDSTYWDRHLTGTEVVSNCSGRSARSGNYYLHRNYYTGGYDSCLGSTPSSIQASNNVGYNGAYPNQGYGDNTSFSSAITSNTATLRFYFRTTGNWKNQSGMGFHKFLRFYGAGSGDEASAFVHLERGNNTNTVFRIPDMTGSSWSGIWGTAYTAGADLQDGNWHSVVMRVVRNNDTNSSGNVTISVWWDDWNMEGAPAGSRTVTCPAYGSRFSHVVLQSNWSATYPSSDMGIDLDDIQVWDGEPDGQELPEPEDTTAPSVTGLNPVSGANDVPISTNIIAHVLDAGDGVDEDTISMSVNGSPVAAAISGSAADYTLTYDPAVDFGYNSEVIVTISASDLSGNAMTPVNYSFVTRDAPDTSPPSVQITAPTISASYSIETGIITLSGTAGDNVSLSTVTWLCSTGGSGSATGTTSWKVENITLHEGDNIITVSAQDSSGNLSSDSITVSYSPPEGQSMVTFGDVIGADYPNTLADTYLNINSDVNAGNTMLVTYTWPVNMVANVPVLKWDLAPIPQNAVIESAQLQLYLLDAGGDEIYTLSAHKIINHDPVIEACNGSTYDGSQAWTANSQCYNSIPLAQADIAAADDSVNVDIISGYKVFDVSAMVSAWVASPSSNFGMLINSDTVASANSYRTFASTENADAAQRPKLVVTYRIGEVEDNEAPSVPSGTIISIQ